MKAARKIVAEAEKTTGPQPIATAPREPERTLLLFCPEQAGWQAGLWQNGRWMSTVGVATGGPSRQIRQQSGKPSPPKKKGRKARAVGRADRDDQARRALSRRLGCVTSLVEKLAKAAGLRLIVAAGVLARAVFPHLHSYPHFTGPSAVFVTNSEGDLGVVAGHEVLHHLSTRDRRLFAGGLNVGQL